MMQQTTKHITRPFTDYEYFFNTSNQIAFVVNHDGVIIKCNDAAISFAGDGSKEKINNSDFLSYMYNIQDAYTLSNNLKRSDIDGAHRMENVKLKMTNGLLVNVHITLRNLKNQHKNHWFLIVEWPLHKEKSKIKEQTYIERIQLILDQSRLVYLLIDRNFKIIYFNNSALPFIKSNTSFDIKTGTNILSIVPKKHLPFFKRKFNVCLANKRIVDEYKFEENDASSRWFRIVYVPVLNDNELVDFVLISVEDITDSKNIEEAHEEKRQELRQIIDLVPHFILAKNEDGTIILANKTSAMSFGLTPKELVGRNLLDIAINKKEIEKSLVQDKNVLATGETFVDVNDIHTDYKGDIHYMNTIKVPFIHKGEKAVLIVSDDISELRKSQEQINTLAAILDQTEDIATIKDLKLRIIGANQAFVKAAGKQTLEEVIGKKDIELFGDFDHVKTYMDDDRMAQKLKKGQFICHEEKFIYPDGRIIDTLVKKFPVYNNNMELIATANISRDITELKQAEKSLQESEEKYRNLIHNQGEGAIILDKFSCVTFANPAAEEIFGIPKDQFNGRNLSEFMSKENFAHYLEEIKYLRKGRAKTFEIEIRHTSDLIKILLVTITPNYLINDIYLGNFGIFRDITDRKLTEKALEMSEVSLKNLNATKDKFFNIIAHDLKNPFGSIIGFSELAKKKISNGDTTCIQQYIEFIENASRNGYSLLENLLEWSRSQSGVLKPKFSKINLSELIKHQVSVMQNSASNKEITIQYTLQDGLQVYIDKNMICTVIRNLISNAIKYSHRESTIRIVVKKVDMNAEITITDEGIGMTEKEIAKLFKIDDTISKQGTEHESGTGLGLLICKEFVEKNKGNIWVLSTLGKGSSFVFTVPLISEVRL